MPFIISKLSSRNGKSRKLYYLVENYRLGTKTKRRILVKLGENKTLNQYLNFLQEEKTQTLKRLDRFNFDLENFIKNGKVPPLIFGSAFKIRKQLDWGINYTKADIEASEKKIKEAKNFV